MSYWPKIQLEVTTKCNANCTFCARHKVIHSRRSLGDLAPDLAPIIIKRLSELNQFQISISGLGEPLLYPNLIDLISQIRQLGRPHWLRVNTNGILLKDKLADALIGTIDKLICGLNLPTLETYKEYKQVDNFELVRDNIVNFLHKKGPRKPSTSIKILDFDATHSFLQDAKRFWRQYLNPNDSCDCDILWNWMGLIDEDKYYSSPKKQASFYFCQYFDGRHLTITKDGNAYFCCPGIALSEDHPFNLGNIRSHSIFELLNSQKFNTLRTQHIKLRGFGPLDCKYCTHKYA